LHLYIEGHSKQDVASAYKELKKGLEEYALTAAGAYSKY